MMDISTLWAWLLATPLDELLLVDILIRLFENIVDVVNQLFVLIGSIIGVFLKPKQVKSSRERPF